jgi:hypothetical protein
LLSHLHYPMDTRQLTSSQGEADGVSDGGMTLQALGGVNLPCGWYRVRGQLPSTGGQEHTHTHRVLEVIYHDEDVPFAVMGGRDEVIVVFGRC